MPPGAVCRTVAHQGTESGSAVPTRPPPSVAAFRRALPLLALLTLGQGGRFAWLGRLLLAPGLDLLHLVHLLTNERRTPIGLGLVALALDPAPAARAERQGEERAVLPVGQTFRFPASAQRRGLPRVWAACTCCELIFLGRRLRRRTGTADEQLVYLFAELVVHGQSLRCD